jgi:hypothetical protein
MLELTTCRAVGTMPGEIPMTDFLLVGALMGLIIGLLHVAYLSRVVACGTNSVGSGTRVSALNFAIWTCGLWILMGAYLLGFWLIAVVFYVVFKAYR